MATIQVETYDTTEVYADGTTSSSAASEARALQIIEQLGLEGQSSLIIEDGESKTRTPFRKMTELEAKVYEQICPKHVKIAEYKDGAIPARVLEVAAIATPMFDYIEIWSVNDADIIDPVMIGFNKINTYGVERFLLARWGEHLAPFTELMLQAGRLRRIRAIERTKDIIARATAALAAAEEADAETAIDLSLPTYYA